MISVTEQWQKLIELAEQHNITPAGVATTIATFYAKEALHCDQTDQFAEARMCHRVVDEFHTLIRGLGSLLKEEMDRKQAEFDLKEAITQKRRKKHDA